MPAVKFYATIQNRVNSLYTEVKATLHLPFTKWKKKAKKLSHSIALFL